MGGGVETLWCKKIVDLKNKFNTFKRTFKRASKMLFNNFDSTKF